MVVGRIARVRRQLTRLAMLACLTPAALAAQVAWSVVAPRGDTRCAFDTPFEFWVREGDPARLFIYLQGGGACWSLDSCDPSKAAPQKPARVSIVHAA